jgi:hypothetical protein
MKARPARARMRRARWSLAVVAATVAGSTAPAGPAHAQWAPPVPISATGQIAEGVGLTAGSDGRVLVAWAFRQPSGLAGFTAVSRRPDGRWGPQRTLGAALTSAGPGPRRAGAGEGLVAMAPYGRNRWIGLVVAPSGRRQILQWWEGTTAGGARRAGTLRGEPWEAGGVAAGPGGAAVVAWTTMAPRRGAGSNLRPRVVLVARRSAAGRPFSSPHRVSPLPPPPPYGHGRGPALSATAVTVVAGGRRTVAVAWHRQGTLEARISRDGGRTFGPVRRVGACPEPFPRIALRVSAGGDVIVLWGARERAGDRHALVYRVARSPRPRGEDGARVSTELRPALLERTPPVAVPFPIADQYGPAAAAAFAGGSPVVAWQGVDAGRIVVRAARLDALGGGRQTLPAPEGQTPVLADLLVRDGVAALAWHAVGPLGEPLEGRVALGAEGEPLGPDELLPGGVGVLGLRLARVPGGVLAAWHGRGPSAVVTSFRPAGEGAP